MRRRRQPNEANLPLANGTSRVPIVDDEIDLVVASDAHRRTSPPRRWFDDGAPTAGFGPALFHGPTFVAANLLPHDRFFSTGQ